MKISINWIKDFVDLTGISDEEIIKRFQFDLEMGFFKVDKIPGRRFQDSIIFKSKDNRKLVKVLGELGFIGGYPLYKESPILIFLNGNDKKYQILAPYTNLL